MDPAGKHALGRGSERSRRLVGVGALGLLLASAGACGRDESTPRRGTAVAEMHDELDATRTRPPARYMGSKLCSTCHAEVYELWTSSRHSSSVISASRARAAGYPLPPSPAGTERSWDDISWVIGGRKRIAYAGSNGRVLDTAYHHRVSDWRPFPSMAMDCAPCHVTGPGETSATATADATGPSPGYAELNIGCESCHGPGERHVESSDSRDIVVDASSRTCGGCHTEVKRVLPVDDRREGHDLVQNWNSNPHATGVRFHSHNAFCSRCHSPRDAQRLESEAGVSRPVFSESKNNITCVGCHDPHDVSHPVYASGRVVLDPPSPPAFRIYLGDDQDFTTSDYRAVPTNEEVCTHCHAGADRIDLDHANAACSDCHNAFHSNRSPESRVLHDANRPELSCRPCHSPVEADHLMTMLFRDPAFLQPRYVHNLKTLPDRAVERHRLSYPRLRGPGAPSARSGAAVVVEALPTDAPVQEPDPLSAARSRAAGLLERLGTEADEEMRSAAQALVEQPDELPRVVDLAVAYAGAGRLETATEVIRFASQLDSPRVLLEIPFEAPREPEASAVEEAESIVAALVTEPESVTGRWLAGYLLLTEGRFAEARSILASPAASAPDATNLRFQLALAEMGEGRLEIATEILEAALEERSAPERVAARAALGLVHLERRRFEDARRELERHRTDPVASYLLGRGHLDRNDAEAAIVALRRTTAAAPDLVDGWFSLARAYRLGGLDGAAVRAYQELIRLRPSLFEGHYQLGSLYKWRSDSLLYRWRAESETSGAARARTWERRAVLDDILRRSREQSRLALSEFAIALKLRPGHLQTIRQVAAIARHDGRLEQAREIFVWLSSRDPDSWLFQYRLGCVLLELGRLPEAVEALTSAIALAPGEGDSYFALGLAYLRAGDTEKAVEVLETGAIFEPFNPALYTNLGAAYAMRGDYLRARARLERSLELATFPLPRLHLTWANLGLLERREGRPQRARRAFENAVHVFPGWEEGRHLLEDEGASSPFFVNDLLEIFGEVSTVSFEP